MIGDFFREASVLVLVFALLDKMVRVGMPDWWFVSKVLIASGICLAVGMAFEKWRSDA
jgi:hypothetical protein